MNRFNKYLAARFLSATTLLISTALIVSLGLSLAPRMASAAGNTYSKATYLTRSQFLHELKEVAVTYAFDPWIAKYVSEAEQRAYVTKALARYNIAVRPNAPVSLLVTLDHVPTTIDVTTTFYKAPSETRIYHDHNFIYSMAFFVRAAALRDGKFHLLIASPAGSSGTFSVEENNEVRKLFIGDELRPDIMQSLAQVWPQALEEIASSTTVDTTPWPVNSWTEKQKAAADAAYTTIMNTQSKVETRPIDGLNSVPMSLELTPNFKDKRCVADPLWRSLWQAEFQRLGWVKTQGESVALYHAFSCDVYGGSPYFILVDVIELNESNLVFELNGRLVRKPAIIFSSHRMMTPLPDQLAATLQGYLPRSITEFVTNLTLGNQTVPVVATASDLPPAVPPAAIPRTNAPRMAPRSAEPSKPAPAPAPNRSMTPEDNPIGEGGFITPYKVPKK